MATKTKWIGFLILVLVFGNLGIGYSQTHTITFDEQKWSSAWGHKYYHGGAANTLSDTELGVNFIIVYGEMIVNLVNGTRMLFFSPIISTNQTVDPRGRILVTFNESVKRIKFKGSHDYTTSSQPASMTATFYQNDASGAPLQSLTVTDNVMRSYEYSNSTVGIKTLVLETQWFENSVDDIEFESLSGGTSTVKFDFNDGTVQGWTILGAFTKTGDAVQGPFSSNFSLDWQDAVNYSTAPGKDPTGDSKGALRMATSNNHGINNPGATWWIMQLYSPELTNKSEWQTANGYTVEIAECMGVNTTLYAELYIKVYDQDQSRDRSFTIVSLEPIALQHDTYGDNNSNWNHLTLDWGQRSGFPTHYQVKQIFINIWGKMSDNFSGGVFLDDVTMIPGAAPQTPAAPTNLDAILLGGTDQIHVVWQDNAQNESGFVLQSKTLPGLGNWSDLVTLGPDVTSYQVDNLQIGNKYYFRVKSYNANGSSAYSNVDSISVLIHLNWIALDSPNGDEQWSVGSVQQIQWRSSALSRPAFVNLIYSTDGGSHWISPAVASNFSNSGSSGSYSWTVPNTPSTNCLMKLQDASLTWYYDLSNKPFTITTVQPPVLTVSTNALNFGTTGNSLTFNISNSGSGTLTWTVNESPDKSWITTVSPNAGTNNATVTVSVDRNQLQGDSDTGSLVVGSNGGQQTITVSVSKSAGTLPAHWNFASNTGNNATLILPTAANPNIDGTPLASGDWIGLFTPAGMCCGRAQWQAGQNLSVTAWGNNDQTQAVDGFMSGETIGYRVYRTGTQKEWTSVSVGYSQGNGTYAVNAILILNKFNASDLKTLTLNLGQGWNLFSMNVTPSDPAIAMVLKMIVNNVVLVKNGNGQTYIPEYAIDNIKNVNVKEGYQAYIKNASTLEIIGLPVDLASSVSLPAGWSMIAYLPQTSMGPGPAWASILNQLVLAKNNAGQTFIPQYAIDNIQTLQPGQGYQVYLDAPAVLLYPQVASMPKPASTSRESVSPSRPLLALDHFRFTANTGENATVVIPASIQPRYSDGSALDTGDEIGIFTTAGRCCGAVGWTNANLAVTVWGNNSQTDSLDGFQIGDTLRYRIWDKSKNVEYTARIKYQSSTPATYQVNGYSVVTELTAGSALTGVAGERSGSLPDRLRLHQNFPNPFNPSTTIVYDLPHTAEVVLNVYDVRANRIRTLVNGVQPAGNHRIPWNGLDEQREAVPSGIYFYRLETREEGSTTPAQSAVQKMVLMK